MIGLITALSSEARPLVDAFNLKKDQGTRRFDLYRSDDLSLIVSGIGKIKSAIAVTILCQKFELSNLVNVGICGSRNMLRPVGQALAVHKITDATTGRDFYPELITDYGLEEGALTTFDRVVTEDTPLEPNVELIDMEASGFFEAASYFLELDRIHILKVVSDHLNVNHVTREFVAGLITRRVDDLRKVLTLLPAPKAPLFSPDELLDINRLVAHFRLTSTQQYQVLDWIRTSKVKGKFTVSLLEEFARTQPMGKSATKAILKNLHDHLV